MIWQDFMFACSMYPANDEFLESVSEEVKHQVQNTSKMYPCIHLLSCVFRFEDFKAIHQLYYGQEIMKMKKLSYKIGTERIRILTDTKRITSNFMWIQLNLQQLKKIQVDHFFCQVLLMVLLKLMLLEVSMTILLTTCMVMFMSTIITLMVGIQTVILKDRDLLQSMVGKVIQGKRQ
jgi:hypothetical protein